MANTINIILFITGLTLIIVSCYVMFGVLSLLIGGAVLVALSLIPVQKKDISSNPTKRKGGS
ncbi:MAG: hypothetical protein FWE57_10510 [Chitinispirillia bacterium]|nr:hypothetical protein [Chitinispirillia bacterium]